LPRKSGVYLYLDRGHNVIYVGKAVSLLDRVKSYFTSNLEGKTEKLVEEIRKIAYLVTDTEVDALILESDLIKKYQPKYNSELKDGKNYPLIEINYESSVPYIRIVRKVGSEKNKYFGPYPKGNSAYQILRNLRRIYPYNTLKHHPKAQCQFGQIGLCPCPSFSNYHYYLVNIGKILSGQKKTLVQKLKTQMLRLARDLRFEEAEILKKQAEILSGTQPRNPWEYRQNPLLITQIRQEETRVICELLNIQLRQHFKIEGYDISHFQSGQTVCGLVVFIDGEPEKSLYRRFKIKSKGDDYASLKEAIRRRLNHPEWAYPDLILIDGGLGQIRAIGDVGIKMVGLAKVFEKIYTLDNKVIKLLPDSPALKLLQRVRDESHRYSRTYNLLLRRKDLLYYKQ